MPETTPPAPALVIDFVNTLDIETGSDAIDSPGALRRWIEQRLGARFRSVDEEAWRTAIDTRESLRDLLASHSGVRLDPAALEQLNRAGRSTALQPRFNDEGEASLEPTDPGVNWALGRILEAVVTAQSDGSWDRLKVCQAENCRFAFYDHSKNRSGRWCTMRVCGNRAKTKTYRQRHA